MQGPFGKEVIECTVNDQFHVRSKGSCTEAPELKKETRILVLGYDHSCDTSRRCYSSTADGTHDNSIAVNGTYIIAGKYVTRGECGDTLWFAPHRSLVLPFSSANHQKFSRMVDLGNFKRLCTGTSDIDR